jgi:replicative DNA helicase
MDKNQQVVALPLIPYTLALNQSKIYVQKRRNGEIPSLKTKFNKLNEQLMGGLELNSIITISALSGGGKSTLSMNIRNSIAELNSVLPIVQIIFNFEMLAHHQIGRYMSNKVRIKLKDLYSSNTILTDSQYSDIMKRYDDWEAKNYPMYFVEVSDSAKKIKQSLWYYYETLCKPTGSVLMYEIDHALLTRGKEGDKEKDKIDNLMQVLVELKKEIASDGGNSVGIILSQMNREIKSIERVTNPSLHSPVTSDLFGASSIEFASDVVLIQHIPVKINIKSYTESGYPVEYIHILPDGTEEFEDAMYLHIVKNRSGEPGLIIPLINELKYFNIEELETEEFNKRVDQFKKKSIVKINEN